MRFLLTQGLKQQLHHFSLLLLLLLYPTRKLTKQISHPPRSLYPLLCRIFKPLHVCSCSTECLVTNWETPHSLLLERREHRCIPQCKRHLFLVPAPLGPQKQGSLIWRHLSHTALPHFHQDLGLFTSRGPRKDVYNVVTSRVELHPSNYTHKAVHFSHKVVTFAAAAVRSHFTASVTSYSERGRLALVYTLFLWVVNFVFPESVPASPDDCTAGNSCTQLRTTVKFTALCKTVAL